MVLRNKVKRAVKEAKKTSTPKKLIDAVKAIDKAAKKNLVHKNKAARIKSRLAKLSKSTKKTSSK